MSASYLFSPLCLVGLCSIAHAQPVTQPVVGAEDSAAVEPDDESAANAETPARAESAANAETPARAESAANAETPARAESAANAATPARAESAANAETPANAKTAKSKTAKKKSLSWSGRVFAGDTLTRREVGGNIFWRNEQAVSSARVALRYEHPKGIRAVIKLEARDGKAEIRDANIRLKLPVRSTLRAGRFKKPISSIALASRWDLPSVERGLLDSVTVEGQPLPFAGGRGEGLMLDFRAPLVGKTGLSVALMQNDLGVGEVTLDAKEDFAQDFFARFYVEAVEGLQLASTVAVLGYLSKGTRDSFRHAAVGTLEVQYEGRWLHAWAEVIAGKSPFARVDGSTDGKFWAARTLVAPRFRPGVPRRLEPFLGASAFDPRISESNNANYEVMGGANLAFAKDWRLQLEVAQVIAEGLPASATDSTAIRIQLGARFKE